MPDLDDQTAKITVLVVDDSPNDLRLMNALLKNIYTTRTANSGERALKAALQEPKPDIILLDITMPGMDGYEVCKRLKSNPSTRNIPVIFLTAKAETEDEQKGLELGAVDYITKPISPPIVLARVKNHLSLKAAADFLSDRNAYLEQEVQRRTHEAIQHADEARALRERQAALVQAEKLASLSSLVVGISHELNTPLGNALLWISTLSHQIQGLTQTIESGNLRRSTLSDFTATANDTVQLIEKSIVRSADLVCEFKDSAMGETLEAVTEFELDEMISALLRDMAGELAHCQIQVQVQIPPGLVMCSYPLALGQVIRQLVMNVALHAYAENQPGTLRVTAEQESNDVILLSVSDNGIGIAPEKLARVFDPFYTTRRGPGSKGLGLTLVQRLTSQLMGGTVDLRSTQGLGTQVTLKIPLSAPPPS